MGAFTKLSLETPYDRGSSWVAWVGGEKFTLSADSAQAFIGMGVPVATQPNEQFATEEVLEAVRDEVHEGYIRVSKKLSRAIGKPRPIQVHPSLKGINERLQEAQVALREAQERVTNIEVELLEGAAKLLNLDSNYLVLGSYQCRKSPLGACIYNDSEDPCHDSCLCCGQPEERK